ncbi:hypothetical protein A7P89_01560 [Eikenella corrodens]|uniref:Uncharacterized protein n=1 Tax=Eikenella corrodens TaxID=539 RepID=A0A1A9RS37_EIKCO|nr:hypothetical protein A7P89_01560 [Eikenella corrodens]
MQQELRYSEAYRKKMLIMLPSLLLQRHYVRRTTLFAGLKQYMEKIGLYLLLYMIDVCAA